MLVLVNATRTLIIGRPLRKVGGIAVEFVFALLGTLRNLIASGDSTTQEDDALDSSVRGGELNFRTGKFDDGTDPAGWYGRD